MNSLAVGRTAFSPRERDLCLFEQRARDILAKAAAGLQPWQEKQATAGWKRPARFLGAPLRQRTRPPRVSVCRAIPGHVAAHSRLWLSLQLGIFFPLRFCPISPNAPRYVPEQLLAVYPLPLSETYRTNTSPAQVHWGQWSYAGDEHGNDLSARAKPRCVFRNLTARHGVRGRAWGRGRPAFRLLG